MKLWTRRPGNRNNREYASMKFKRWLFIVVMVILGGGFGIGRNRRRRQTYETVSVARGDVTETVSASVSLVASMRST